MQRDNAGTLRKITAQKFYAHSRPGAPKEEWQELREHLQNTAGLAKEFASIYGVYVSYGAINPQLASKTWFEGKDAVAIKNALEHLFDNDSSSARPEGSMEVVAVFWWQHNCNNGQYSSAVVHRALSVAPKEGVTEPKKIEDYSIKLKGLSGLTPAIFNPNNVVIEIN